MKLAEEGKFVNVNKGKIVVDSVSDEKYRSSKAILNPKCKCESCARDNTLAYLHHLFRVSELNGVILLLIHNLTQIKKL